jgi:hypothetical protein
MYESMARDLAPISGSIAAVAIVLLISFTAPADPEVPDQEAPLACAGKDLSVAAGETLTLDGTASSDDVEVVSWRWSLEYAGSPVTFRGETALVTLDVPGVYAVTLTVADAAGNTGSDEVRITVLP